MSLIVLAAPVCRVCDFCLIFVPFGHYDEPEILSYAIPLICSIGDDVRQYDLFSNHLHVSPTSSVRMLYRQKIWDKNERKINWRRVRISTKSNSNEKLASGGIDMLLPLRNLVERDVVANLDAVSVKLEKIGKEIYLQNKINQNADKEIYEMLSMHDRLVVDFLGKLEKYGKPTR